MTMIGIPVSINLVWFWVLFVAKTRTIVQEFALEFHTIVEVFISHSCVIFSGRGEHLKAPFKIMLFESLLLKVFLCTLKGLLCIEANINNKVQKYKVQEFS